MTFAGVYNSFPLPVRFYPQVVGLTIVDIMTAFEI